MWQYLWGMEEQPHSHNRHRRRRVRLTLAGSLILAALVLLSAHTNPVTGTDTSTPGRGSQSAAEGSSAQSSSSNSVKQALENAQPGLWTVVRDVDGDTIDVQQGSTKEAVRLIGVDTPETHDPRKPVQCFGEAAAAHTKSLAEGKNVRLEADPTDSDRDKYHRLLRYVYLPDGTLLNAELIQDGWGFAYTIFPNEKLDEFRALESEARNNNRGLWAGCNVDSSSDIKQTAGSK
jgi:micrococcal nuclease